MRRNPGPLPDPIEQKKRRGNPGRQKLPDALDPESNVVALAPLDQVPEPPKTLGQAGRDLWHEVWTLGAVWLAQTDVLAVRQLCELHDEYSLLRYRVLETMKDPSAPDPWRLRVALRDVRQQILLVISSLGLSPADRARLGLAEVVTRRQALKLHEDEQRFFDKPTSREKTVIVDAIAPKGGDEIDAD